MLHNLICMQIHLNKRLNKYKKKDDKKLKEKANIA